MKVAVVILPKNSETNFSAEQPAPPMQVFLFGRPAQVIGACALAGCAMLLVALTCLTTLVVAGTFSRSRAVTGSPIPKAQQVVEARHEVTGEEMAGLPVSLEKIRRGDTVVVNQKGALGLRQVSTSNECVIVKRDNAVQGLYLLGEGSYLVVSDKESKVVRAGTALASARR